MINRFQNVRELVVHYLIGKKEKVMSLDCEHDFYSDMVSMAKYFQSIGINTAIPWHRESVVFSLSPIEQQPRWGEDDKDNYYDTIYNARPEDKYKFMEE